MREHFLCEFITGGGMRSEGSLSPSLLREGAAMRDALLWGLLDAGKAVCMGLDDRLPLPKAHPRLRIEPVDGGKSVWEVWHGLLATSGSVWPIAPETNGSLLKLTGLAEASKANLFGSSRAAVELCSSKSRLLAHLSSAGIPCIETWSLEQAPIGKADFWVVKPDCGAGCEQTQCLAREALPQWRDGLRHAEGSWIAQPCLPNALAASLTLLVIEGDVAVLACNRQQVGFGAGVGKMAFEGVEVNGYAEFRAVLTGLAKRIAAAIPGLAGLAGVDLMITRRRPLECLALEVNARPTTAIAGLERSLGQGPLPMVMRSFETGSLPDPAELDSMPVWIPV